MSFIVDACKPNKACDPSDKNKICPKGVTNTTTGGTTDNSYQCSAFSFGAPLTWWSLRPGGTVNGAATYDKDCNGAQNTMSCSGSAIGSVCPKGNNSQALDSSYVCQPFGLTSGAASITGGNWTKFTPVGQTTPTTNNTTTPTTNNTTTAPAPAFAFANLAIPTTMPNSEKVRLKNLQCPPPFKPSQANATIRALNSSIQAQQTQIEILEKVISDLEKRYKIIFTCDNAPTFFLSNNDSITNTIVDLSGTITNPNISIQMIPGSKGNIGNPGFGGPQGPSGKASISGPQGQPGYYGMRGDISK